VAVVAVVNDYCKYVRKSVSERKVVFEYTHRLNDKLIK